jgi:hypothetical protein
VGDKDVKVYVALVDDGVPVWRPVRARHVSGNVYTISDQAYDTEVETWEFTPGMEVVCEERILSGGKCLVAITEHLRREG